MNVISEVSKDLKENNPHYWKLMRAITGFFLFCIFCFFVNLFGIWVESETIRIVSIALVGLSIFFAILCFFALAFLFFVSFFKRYVIKE